MKKIDHESLSLSTNPRFLEILARSRARLEAEGGIPLAEMIAWAFSRSQRAAHVNPAAMEAVDRRHSTHSLLCA